jgi:hypothetical protein
MATFSAWLTAQRERPDMVGDFSRFWESVTPGRISTPTGMRRHLDKVLATFERTGDEDGLAQVSAALKGFNVAVDSYHREQALENAIETGAVPRPDADASAARYGYTPDESGAGRTTPDNAGQPDNPGPDGPASDDLAAFMSGPETVSPDSLAAAHERAQNGARAAYNSGESNIHPNHQLPGEFELTAEDGKPGIRRKKAHAAPGESVTVQPGDRIQVGGRQLKPGETVTAPQLPESRFDRLEASLDALAAVLAAQGVVLEQVRILVEDVAGYSAPVDWQQLWLSADAYESQGGGDRD